MQSIKHQISKMANSGTALQNKIDHALIGAAKSLPISAPTPFISVSPLIFPIPGRLVDLQLKVSAPTTGSKLPIILLSHGHGPSNNLSSLNGYGPIANFWASHGFVVIQPTHLSSRTLKLPPETPGFPLFYRSRVEDMSRIIDRLSEIESSVPTLAGRLDHTRIAVAGHSMGGQTASMLLGTTITEEDGTIIALKEPRIKAGVLLAPPGNGGADLSEFAAQFTFFRAPNFASMTTPALIVVNDADVSPHLTTRGADWHADPYTHSPGAKSLLTFFGEGHGLGGVSGWDAKETQDSDESPECLAAVQRLTWAYLRTALYPEDGAWEDACVALKGISGVGKIESKV
jgi:predicted dienelactone hydrolase